MSTTAAEILAALDFTPGPMPCEWVASCATPGAYLMVSTCDCRIVTCDGHARHAGTMDYHAQTHTGHRIECNRCGADSVRLARLELIS